MTKDNSTGKPKDFYENGAKMFDRLNPQIAHKPSIVSKPPAAWRVFRNNVWTYRPTPGNSAEERVLWQPLFTHRQEWVGLTDEEIKDLTHRDITPWMWIFLKNYEQALREKNT